MRGRGVRIKTGKYGYEWTNRYCFHLDKMICDVKIEDKIGGVGRTN